MWEYIKYTETTKLTRERIDKLSGKRRSSKVSSLEEEPGKMITTSICLSNFRATICLLVNAIYNSVISCQ